MISAEKARVIAKSARKNAVEDVLGKKDKWMKTVYELIEIEAKSGYTSMGIVEFGNIIDGDYTGVQAIKVYDEFYDEIRKELANKGYEIKNYGNTISWE